MAYASVNGIPVTAGCLTLPRSGVWTALVSLDTSDAITREAKIDWGGLDLHGSLVRGGMESGSLWCQIVGGNGGLGRQMPAAGFRSLKLGAVLDAIMSASGEALSPSISSELLGRRLAWFAIAGGQSCGSALTRLAEAAAIDWRVLPDGRIWIGRESWPKSDASGDDIEVIEIAMASDRFRARMPDASKALPGQTWSGGRIDRIEHSLSGSDFSSVIWLDREDEGLTFLAAASEG